MEVFSWQTTGQFTVRKGMNILLDKHFSINIDRQNKMILVIVFGLLMLASAGISVLLKNMFRIKGVESETIMLVVLIFLCWCLAKWGKDMPDTQLLETTFSQDYVLLKRGKKATKIYYCDIREVEKIMVMRSQTYQEKGYYRVRIKMKGKNYVMYSTSDEYEHHLDFEETELSQLYFEFENRGIKCC